MSKKTKKKRKPPIECAKAIHLTNRLFYIGGIVTILGIVIGSQVVSTVVLCLLVFPGIALMAAGYFLHTRWVLCPHCLEYLGEGSKMIRKLPDFCPSCQEELQ